MRRFLRWSVIPCGVVGCADAPTEGATVAAGATPELLFSEAGSYGGGQVLRSQLMIDSATGELTWHVRELPPGGVPSARYTPRLGQD